MSCWRWQCRHLNIIVCVFIVVTVAFVAIASNDRRLQDGVAGVLLVLLLLFGYGQRTHLIRLHIDFERWQCVATTHISRRCILMRGTWPLSAEHPQNVSESSHWTRHTRPTCTFQICCQRWPNAGIFRRLARLFGRRR